MKNLIIACLVLRCVTFNGYAQSISQWRGEDRKGIYPESGLLESWPAGGPGLLWSVNGIGNGYGSPTIAGDRMYITGEIDSTAWLYALDLKGNILWKSEFGKEWTKTFQGSRSAPTVVDNLIYVVSGNGKLACFDNTGKKRWFIDSMKDFNAGLPLHGHAESPLVDGNKVFLVPGGTDCNVAAFDRFTGKLLWKNKGRGETQGYNSPVLIKLKDVDLMVTLTSYSLMGFDTQTGQMLWFHEQINTPVADRKPGNGDTHTNSVWFENGFLYYIAGDGNGAVKLRLSPDGKEITQVWRNKEMDNFMGGFIIQDDKIFSCTNAHKDLRTLDKNTGVETDSLKCGTGNIILADNHLYYYNQKGEMKLLDMSGPKLKEISTFKITAGTKEHFSHPVIHDGILYLRHGQALLAYNIRKQ